jgi:hypothetical protein
LQRLFFALFRRRALLLATIAHTEGAAARCAGARGCFDLGIFLGVFVVDIARAFSAQFVSLKVDIVFSDHRWLCSGNFMRLSSLNQLHALQKLLSLHLNGLARW